jgi:hypothetical protein
MDDKKYNKVLKLKQYLASFYKHLVNFPKKCDKSHQNNDAAAAAATAIRGSQRKKDTETEKIREEKKLAKTR